MILGLISTEKPCQGNQLLEFSPLPALWHGFLSGYGVEKGLGVFAINPMDKG
jgi:hypothetical protein